jgi:hypothetical protein
MGQQRARGNRLATVDDISREWQQVAFEARLEPRQVRSTENRAAYVVS